MLSDVALEFEYLCLIGFIAKSTNRGSVHSSAGIGDHKKKKKKKHPQHTTGHPTEQPKPNPE